MDVLTLAIVLIGLALSKILFYKIPIVTAIDKKTSISHSVSIIIPARNEEVNLALLLEDLSNQSYKIKEIICVDDDSSDSTAVVAEKYDVKLISLKDKPEDWMGKSWACQNGANMATGDLLLFLDADVRFDKDGIRSILELYQKEKCTISVQPFHKTEKNYEQFSLIFNLIQVAANGISLAKPIKLGLYGPIILISRDDYIKIGQHESIKGSIIDDISLGRNLRNKALPYKLYVGNKDLYFRMYGDGLHSLFQGWTKNMASGASEMPLLLFLAVFLWISSLISIPLHLVKSIYFLNLNWTLLYLAIYIIWVVILKRLGKKIGQFKTWAFVLFPINMIVFLFIFFVSVFKKIFGIKVTWKDRSIKVGDK